MKDDDLLIGREQKAFSDIDWSTVTLPQGTTKEDVERAYKSAAEDLTKLDQAFDRYFSGKKKKASIQMMTTSIFDVVHTHVIMHPEGYYDTSGLKQFIAVDDRPLATDVITFVYEFFQDKPLSIRVFNKFKALLTFYLCKVGF